MAALPFSWLGLLALACQGPKSGQIQDKRRLSKDKIIYLKLIFM